MDPSLPVDSRWLFTALVALVVGARLGELRYSRRNEARLVARGACEAGSGHFPVMVLLHAGWLVAAPLEVHLLERPLLPPLAVACLLLLAATFALRYWVIGTLGERWTTRIYVLPGERVVADGPYRFLRHPNYLGVLVETAALPLVHTAWLTALLFTAANGVLLAVRIRAEERALASASDYAERMSGRAALLPRRP